MPSQYSDYYSNRQVRTMSDVESVRYAPPVLRSESSRGDRGAGGGGSGQKRLETSGNTLDAASTSLSRSTSAGYHRPFGQGFETSVSLQLWQPGPSLSSSSSAFSRTGLLRDVPQVRKKLSKKDSQTQRPSFDSSPNLESRSFSSWLKEKPSKTKLGGSMPLQKKAGQWRKVTAMLRDDGVLSIFDEDRALVHSIKTPILWATEVREVDSTLFSKLNVLGIFSRPSSFGIDADNATQSPARPSSSGHEPIFLQFPSRKSLKMWKALLRSFARPEIFGPPESSLSTGTHRMHRQIILQINELKLSRERMVYDSAMASRSNVMAKGGSIRDPVAAGQEIEEEQEEEGDEESWAAGSATDASTSDRPSTDTGSLDLSASASSPSMLPKDGHNSSSDVKEADFKIQKSYDSDAEDEELMESSGPISGISGAERMKEKRETINIPPFTPQMGSSSAIVDGGGTIPAGPFQCVVRLGGDVAARTKISSHDANVWYEKITLYDLPKISDLQVAVWQLLRNGKWALLGLVDVPVETMRRGEQIHGFFQVWATQQLPRDNSESGALADLLTTRKTLVGELRLDVTILEEVVLALRKYDAVTKALDDPDSSALIADLYKYLEEGAIMERLADVFISQGTIVRRLADLARVEGKMLVNKKEDAVSLLFRENTPFSRIMDVFQRRVCTDWLDTCVGPTLRRVCNDKIWINFNSASQGMSHELGRGALSSEASSGDGQIDKLERLCSEIMANLLLHRDSFPRDVREALYNLRITTEENYRSVKATGLGLQAVGAFVFLRLICAGLKSPQLLGLMPVAPDPESTRTLVNIAKVLLALANKTTFEYKETSLIKANNFLQSHAAMYDNFVLSISSSPNEGRDGDRRWQFGDEVERDFHIVVESRLSSLPRLHLESIPRLPHLVERGSAVAALASFVVRYAEDQANESSQKRKKLTLNNNESVSDGSSARLEYFIDQCCEVEDLAGYYQDLAGYESVPLTSISRTSNQAVAGTKYSRPEVNLPSVTSTPVQQRTESEADYQGINSQRSRSATVSTSVSPSTVRASPFVDSPSGRPHTKGMLRHPEERLNSSRAGIQDADKAHEGVRLQGDLSGKRFGNQMEQAKATVSSPSKKIDQQRRHSSDLSRQISVSKSPFAGKRNFEHAERESSDDETGVSVRKGITAMRKSFLRSKK